MLGKVFKAYDIRGTYPDPLNEKMTWRIGYGVGKFLLEEAREAGERTPMMRNIVVGHDIRPHSESLRDALKQGLADAGATVICVGKVDTPFIYFTINHLDCAGGIVVTASHNPINYNGFKVSRRKAKPVGEMNGLAVARKYAATVEDSVKGTGGETWEDRDLWDAYRRHVRNFLDLGKRPLKVVIDASNGMAGTMVPKIFGRRGSDIDGVDIVEVNFDNSKGEFVHEPNPLVPENLQQVREKVVSEEADFGVCFDGDADRLVVIDEQGNPVGCDHLTAWLARGFLEERGGGAIVYDLRSSKAVEEEVRDAGGDPIRCRVGHVFMKEALARTGALFGGELSGHFYFEHNFNADSGAIALATVLSRLSREKRNISELVKPIQRYHQSGEINFEVEDKDAAIEELAEHYMERGDLDELDGITIDCFEDEGWWCNIRKSNTEPLLRLNLEAKSKDTLDKALGEINGLLGQTVEQ